MKSFSISNIFIFFLLFTFRVTGQDIRELLPSSEELPGWKLSHEPSIYDGDRLFELINGGADIYLEYGFNQVVSTQYTDPSQNNILVEIYEMSDDSAAYGIFSITQQIAGWTHDFGNLSSVSNEYISFWKGKYYVNLSWLSKQHINEPLLDRLAGIISGNIEDLGKYPLLLKTFSEDDPLMKEIYLEGNLSLSNFYYIDYKDVFKVSQGLAISYDGYHRIILKYSSGDDAAEVLSVAKQSMANNKRFSGLVNAFQGFSCSDNKGNSILVRHVDEYIVILVGIKPGISLVPVMDDLSHKIEGV
jgi:hypothetical protein